MNIPAPAFDLPQTPDSKLQTAVLAGGCFWGVQAVFQHIKEVNSPYPAIPAATKPPRITKQ